MRRKLIAAIAKIARRLGLYHPIRALYVRLDPELRRQQKLDRTLYGAVINRGDLVFDIGANKGQKTSVFKALGATVIAAEPNPFAAKILRYSYRSAPEIHVIEMAVGAEPGKATLHFQNTDTRSSLRSDWKYFDYRRSQTVEVEVTTLRSLIEQFGVPDFCKIDVEGFELDVIRGNDRALPCLSLEFHKEEVGRLLDCLAHLEQFGPVEVNAISMNGEAFLFETWKSAAQMSKWLTSGALSQGDIFIRSVVPSLKPEFA